MNINRDIFWKAFEDQFGPPGSDERKNLEMILAAMETDPFLTGYAAVEEAAYMLATILRECGESYQPVTERGTRAYFNRYDIRFNPRKARELGNVEPGDGYTFRGRGYVQVTGRTNYTRVTNAWNLRMPVKIDLIAHPSALLNIQISYFAMSYGMHAGLFTGRSLKNYIGDGKADYVNARRIINGLDHADEIAEHAEMFEKILTEATAAPAVVPQPPLQEPVAQPVDAGTPPPAAAVPAPEALSAPVAPPDGAQSAQDAPQQAEAIPASSGGLKSLLNTLGVSVGAVATAVWSAIQNNAEMLKWALIVGGGVVGIYLLRQIILDAFRMFFTASRKYNNVR